MIVARSIAPKNGRSAPNTTGITFVTTWSIRPSRSVPSDLADGDVDVRRLGEFAGPAIGLPVLGWSGSPLMRPSWR